MSVQYVLWGLGVVQIWRYRRLTRALIIRQQGEQGGQGEHDELGEPMDPRLANAD
jgi:hypothetical protein